MKSYEDALAWMQAVMQYRKDAPEGMYAGVQDTFPTLRDVDPKAITRLSQEFTLAKIYNVGKAAYNVQIEGSEEGYYYAVTILSERGHEKLTRYTYRFFYRNQRIYELPDSTPADTPTVLDQGGAPATTQPGAGDAASGPAGGRNSWPTKL